MPFDHGPREGLQPIVRSSFLREVWTCHKKASRQSLGRQPLRLPSRMTPGSTLTVSFKNGGLSIRASSSTYQPPSWHQAAARKPSAAACGINTAPRETLTWWPSLRNLGSRRTSPQSTMRVQPVWRPHCGHLDGSVHTGRPHSRRTSPGPRRGGPILPATAGTPAAHPVSPTRVWPSPQPSPTSSTKRPGNRAYTHRKRKPASQTPVSSRDRRRPATPAL